MTQYVYVKEKHTTETHTGNVNNTSLWWNTTLMRHRLVCVFIHVQADTGRIHSVIHIPPLDPVKDDRATGANHSSHQTKQLTLTFTPVVNLECLINFTQKLHVCAAVTTYKIHKEHCLL